MAVLGVDVGTFDYEQLTPKGRGANPNELSGGLAALTSKLPGV